MKRTEFLKLLDSIIETEPGTIKGHERLAELPKWDSLALLGFIATVDTHFAVEIPIQSLNACTSVADLEALLGGRITT
jgi:acyl carrier protein